MMPKDLYIIFVGDPNRGKRLEKVVKNRTWRVSIVTDWMPALAEYLLFSPDLVVIDEFPDSDLARLVYFHLRTVDAKPILALNSAPNAAQYMHVNSLSFMKMMDRDAKPEELIVAMSDLVRSSRESRNRQHVQQPREIVKRGVGNKWQPQERQSTFRDPACICLDGFRLPIQGKEGCYC